MQNSVLFFSPTHVNSENVFGTRFLDRSQDIFSAQHETSADSQWSAPSFAPSSRSLTFSEYEFGVHVRVNERWAVCIGHEQCKLSAVS